MALQRQPERQAEAGKQLQKYRRLESDSERLTLLLKDAKLEKSLQDADVTCEIGDLFLRLGKEELGLHWLNLTLTHHPQHRPAHRLLADYYERKQQPDKAADHRRQAGS